MVKINWKPTSTDLRKFGLSLFIGFGIIGGLLMWKVSSTAAYWTWSIAGGVGLIAVLLPPLSKPFYWIWMGIAFVMGTIISTFILLMIFYLIITPIALIMKVIGRDALRIKKTSFNSDTYWLDHDEIKDKSYYERLF